MESWGTGEEKLTAIEALSAVQLLFMVAMRKPGGLRHFLFGLLEAFSGFAKVAVAEQETGRVGG